MASRWPIPPKTMGAVAIALVALGVIGMSALSSKDTRPPTTAMISNSGVSILPAQPTGQSELKVSGGAMQAGAFSNSSRDVSDAIWVWSVRGEEVARGETLSPEHFRRGDVVSVRLEDGRAGAKPSAEVVIANSAPRITAARIQRDAQNPMRLIAQIEATDPDEDRLETRLSWVVDGKELAGEHGLILSADALRPGQEVQLDLTISDGELEARYFGGAFKVDNRPPSIETDVSPRLFDENGGRFATLAVRGADPDGDEIFVSVVSEWANWDDTRQAIVWDVVDGQTVFDAVVQIADGNGGEAVKRLKLKR